MPNASKQYLPRRAGTFKSRLENAFRSLAYRLWKRPLEDLAELQSEPLRIADVGCGPGFLLESIHRWFPDSLLTGIDASAELLICLRGRCPHAQALVGDAQNIPLAAGSTDVLFGLHVVEHLEAPEKFFKEARRVLRPGGLLIIATPNPGGLGARWMGERWKGLSDPTHIALHDGRFWRNLALSSGFTVRKDGTTGLSGIPALDRFPLGLAMRIPLLLFGFFPWTLGEAYMSVSVN